jgi:hypothetical protein
MEKTKMMPKRGWKRFYADSIKIYNTGYGAILGRFSGLLNLFFTIATFFLVKQFDLSYTELIIVAIVVFTGLMIAGWLYLKFGFQKAEFSSNFVEQPELYAMHKQIQRIETKLDKFLPKEDTVETKEFKQMFV